MENECDLLHEAEVLQRAVNESSEHTKRQLDAIQSNLSIEAIVSIIIAVGIPLYLDKLVQYWIPSAFLLLIIWFCYSMTTLLYKSCPKQRHSKNAFEKSKIIEYHNNPTQELLNIETLFKNLIPFIMALSIIYIISIFIIILICPSWLIVGKIISYAPIITCLFLLFSSYGAYQLGQDGANNEFKEFFFPKKFLCNWITNMDNNHPSAFNTDDIIYCYISFSRNNI